MAAEAPDAHKIAVLITKNANPLIDPLSSFSWTGAIIVFDYYVQKDRIHNDLTPNMYWSYQRYMGLSKLSYMR